MKKLISILILIFIFCESGQSGRVITGFDIARWYLDSNVVLVCSVNQTDTLMISKYDSLDNDGFHLRYNILREKYHISIDSILKKEQNMAEMVDSIFTPVFSASRRKEKIEFTGFDSNGDSIFVHSVKYSTDYYDDSYFRIKSPEKCLVILSKSEIGYVIDYQSKCDSSTMNLIQEIELQGEDYLNPFSSQTIKSKDFQIYPNPFNNVINIIGIQAKKIEITDINGKTNNVNFEDPNRIDLSHLKSGVYFISIITDKNTWTKKIVKK